MAVKQLQRAVPFMLVVASSVVHSGGGDWSGGVDPIPEFRSIPNRRRCERVRIGIIFSYSWDLAIASIISRSWTWVVENPMGTA